MVVPGATPEVQRKIGKLLRSTFETKIPALGELQRAVAKMVARGWLRMPDGRRTYIRHPHAALNSLLQAAGAIICKAWIVEFDRELTWRYDTPPGGGWDHPWAALGWIHDEVQLAVRADYAADVAMIVEQAAETVTHLFQWRIPLAASADIGVDWSSTH